MRHGHSLSTGRYAGIFALVIIDPDWHPEVCIKHRVNATYGEVDGAVKGLDPQLPSMLSICREHENIKNTAIKAP